MEKTETSINSTNRFVGYVSKINYKYYLLALSFFTIVILIWGFFYSISEVKWDRPSFPSEVFQTASNKYSRLREVDIIDREYLQKEIVAALSDRQNIVTISTIFNKVIENNKNKTVCFKQVNIPLSNQQINLVYEQSKSYVQEKFENADSISERRHYMNLLANYDNLISFANEGRVLVRVSFPQSDLIPRIDTETYTVAIGSITRYRQDRMSIYYEGDFVPATNRRFLSRLNVQLDSDEIQNIERDQNKINDLEQKARSHFNENLNRSRQRIREQRAGVRKQFYERWFSTLFAVLMSILMVNILKRYFSILRRKNLPKKDTHGIYFATNTTSLVFRWISLLVVIIGIINIIINAITQVFTATPTHLIPVPFIYGVSFLYTLLTPVIMTVSTIIASWIFVLTSEYICFISNVYHIAFKYTYRKNTDDNIH